MTSNKIFNNDALLGLKELPDSCINCCVTSPPYYGLRDYGVDWVFKERGLKLE